jgi:hypothetical protein
MKKSGIVVVALACLLMITGCTKNKPTTKAEEGSAKKVDAVQKKEDGNEDQEYEIALADAQSEYIKKREQAKQERENAQKSDIERREEVRLEKYTSLVESISEELQKRNSEELKKIQNELINGQAKVNKQQLEESERQNAQNKIINSTSERELAEKTRYENQKIEIERIKRSYESNMKSLQDELNRELTAFEGKCAEKYNPQYDNIKTIDTDSYSEWELLYMKEKKEIEEFYKAEMEEYKEQEEKFTEELKDNLNKYIS